MKIIHVKHNDINIAKWDKCIREAFNGIIYAYSWYLDIVSEKWEALIVDNYDYIMPLPVSRKMTIPCLHQPELASQLGVFTKKKLDPSIIAAFIAKIPSKFKFIDINLNSYNKFKNQRFRVKQNTVYRIDLVQNYEWINNHYTIDIVESLKKAKKNSIALVNGLSINSIIEILKNDKEDSNSILNEQTLNKLRKLTSVTIHHRFSEVYVAYTAENNLCSMAVFLTSHNKSIMLLSASTNQGIESKAIYLIIDYFISRNCEKNLTLEFKETNVPEINEYYSGFGGFPCKYLNLKRRRLI